MHRSAIAAFSLVASLVPTQTASAQGRVDESTTVHVFRPRRVEATDERISSLRVPDGLRITRFADGLGKPRMLAVADDGAVYVTRRDPGDVLVLRDADGDGRADSVRPAVEKLEHAHGIAIRPERPDEVYIATIRQVLRFRRADDGALVEPRAVLDGLPDAGQHPNRTLAFGPDGMLYLSIGSTCNECDEGNPLSATIIRCNPDGSDRIVFARGLRNTIGFDWHPATRELWGFDHGIDFFGDDVQREELNRLVEGADYGWPFVYEDGKLNPIRDPKGGVPKDVYAKGCTSPARMYTAHAAPLGLVFNRGGRFGADAQGDAFATMHGSWNRKPASGYEVVRVRFDREGRPTAVEPFVTGWLTSNGQEQFGRPCGMAFARDGSLLIGDDDNGVIYKLSGR